MIDDDFFLLELHQMLVQMAGLEDYFLTANGAKDALDVLSDINKKNQEPPKYILLDLNMPIMDGFDFMKYYQDHYANKDFPTKIIIVTSSTRVSDYNKAMSFPFVLDYKTKPLPEKYIESLISGDEL